MVTNSKEENYSDFKNFTFANGWIVSWCAVCLFCLYQHFMQLWVGKELTFPFLTMTLMVYYFFLPRLSTMTFTYREAAGLWWEDRIRPLVSTAVNLTFNILLVHFIGMDGVILSTLVCTIFINIPWGTLILFKHYFKRSANEYFLRLAYYLCITSVAGAATLFLCSFLPMTGLVWLVLKGVLCVLVPNSIFWIFYHKMDEFKYSKVLFRRIAKGILKKTKRSA